MYTLNSSLTYDWGGNCGIPGGIPTDRTQYGDTLTTANSLAEINAAIQAASSGQYVQLAAGNYSLGQITFGAKSGVTLRGAGPGQTVITSTATRAVVNTEDYFRDADGIAISSGYTKGSTSITLGSAPSAYFQVGRLIQITQDDDPDLWATGVGVYSRSGFPGSYGMSATRNLRFTSRITDISGNTITLATPIHLAYTAGLNPKAYPARQASSSLCGLEEMTIVGGGSTDRAVYWAFPDRCWVKDVEIDNIIGTTGSIMLYNASQCEINRVFAHDTPDYPIQADGYPFFLYYGCSCCLIVDCVAHRMGPTAVNGSSANALVNNTHINIRRRRVTNDPQTWITQGIIVNHGPQAAMNLLEGNIFQRFQNDGYHGSSSHCVLFRNNVHGVCPDVPNPTNRRVIDPCRGSYYHSFVGNVLGDASWNPAQYEFEPGDSSNHSIYMLGCPGMDSVTVPNSGVYDFVDYSKVVGAVTDTGAHYFDADVSATVVRHANYDYENNGVVWGDADHTIADSMFYASKPAYFGTLAWPAIGPDVTGYVQDTPARWRWNNYDDGGQADVAEMFRDSPASGGGGEVGSAVVMLTVASDENAKLVVNRSKRRVTAGTAAVYTVRAASFGDFQGDITLDTTGLPTNATDSYGTNPIAYNGSTAVTIATTGVAAGTYNLTITGTSAGATVASVIVVLEVVSAADFDLKVPVKHLRVKQGDNAVYTVKADSMSGYTADIDLTVSGVPSGATAAFGDASLAYNGSTTMTIDTGTATPGTYNLTITGTEAS